MNTSVPEMLLSILGSLELAAVIVLCVRRLPFRRSIAPVFFTFAAARVEMLCAGVFAAASVALWIAWSGEWLEDILVGFCFGYFLCVCACSLKQSGALSRTEWRLFGLLVLLLLLLQGGTFFLPPVPAAAADYAAYGVMFFVMLYALGKTILAVRRKIDPAALFALSASCYAWAESTMYMSAGLFYVAAELCSLICPALLFIALRREEELR